MPPQDPGLKEAAEKVVALKGSGFSRSVKAPKINVALATEGMLPERIRLFLHPLKARPIDLSHPLQPRDKVPQK